MTPQRKPEVMELRTASLGREVGFASEETAALPEVHGQIT